MSGTRRSQLRRRPVEVLVVALLAAAVAALPAAPAAATTCLAGTGTSLDPFLVTDAADLAKVGSGTDGCDSDSFYLQTADITLSGSWTPIASFSGTYDGGDHTISGLVVSEASDDVGLFGSAPGATLRRVHVVDGDVTGQTNTGGLVGYGNNVTVIDASFSGTVTGVGYVGGLVGYGPGATAIARSWSAGTVTGTNDVGGLVGYVPSGGIRSSFSTADVAAADDDAAGLVGYFPASDLEELRVDGTITAATSSGGGSVVAGDAFHWSLTLDLSAALGSGTSAISGFSLAADPSNTGSWLPDAIVWNGTHNVVTNENSEQVTAQIRASSGAPAIDGTAFRDVDLTLRWDASVIDGGASPSDLEEFLGTTRPPLHLADAFGGLRDTTSTFVADFTATLDADLPSRGDLTDVFARGDVTVTGDARWVGGLTGYNPNGLVTRAYTTGAVSVSGTGTDVGGLIGLDRSGSTVDSFWDTETSGQASSDGGTGKTTTQLTSIATFNDTATAGLTTAWPIVAGWQPYVAGTTVWGICEDVNDGYPFLLWRYDSDPCTDPVPTVAAGATLAVTCPADAEGTLPVGTPITCTLTGGDPDIDILWRAASNPTFAEGVVRTGTDGTGTIAFTIPPAAAGSPITVELVAWTAPLPVGTAAGTAAGGPVPSVIPAGGGPSERHAPVTVLVALLIGSAALLAVALRRRSLGSGEPTELPHHLV